MRLSPTPERIPVLNDKPGLIHRDWSKWLKTLHRLLGYDPKVPVWGDIWAGTALIDGGGGAVFGEELETAADQDRYFCVRLPNDYVEGTDVYPFVEWVAADDAAGDIAWWMIYYWGAVAEELVLGATAALGSTDENAALLMRTELTVMTGDVDGYTFKKGTVLPCLMFRLGTEAEDTYGASVYMMGVGFKYEREGIGWETKHP